MKAVLDTNVLVSGIFFGGVPGKILDAWTGERFELFVTPSIFDEYRNTLEAIGRKERTPLISSWITALAGHTHRVLDQKRYPRICRDPHDDMFLYCAASVNADYLVTGDKISNSSKVGTTSKSSLPRPFCAFWKSRFSILSLLHEDISPDFYAKKKRDPIHIGNRLCRESIFS